VEIIMDLTMYNVKFGECIVLENENKEALIIDCGTINSQKIIKNLSNQITSVGSVK
jgi:hypothetical protein